MIIATLVMKLPPRDRVAAVNILKMTAEICRIWPGCISSHIYEDVQESDTLVYQELWRSQQDLNLHIRSEEYGNLLIVLEMAEAKPEVRFDVVSATTGIETIEQVRGDMHIGNHY